MTRSVCSRTLYIIALVSAALLLASQGAMLTALVLLASQGAMLTALVSATVSQSRSYVDCTSAVQPFS